MKNQTQAQEVRMLIVKHIEQKQISQNELSKQLSVSSATISNIINERWDRVKDSMLLSIKGKLNPQRWQISNTANFQNIISICDESRRYKRMVSIIGFTGAGKTTALTHYYKKNANTYMVTCKKSMRPKQLFQQILLSLGINYTGTIYEIIERITEEMNSKENPLLIMDEVSKLGQINLMYLQDLWDSIEHNAGVVLAGVEYFKSNLKKAVERSKMGMPEFYGRVSIWQELFKPTKAEITSICMANGVEDTSIIQRLVRLQNFRLVHNAIQNIKYGLV